MERRCFIKSVFLGGLLWSTDKAAALQLYAVDRERVLGQKELSNSSPCLTIQKQQVFEDDSIKDYLYRIRNPDLVHTGDVFLETKDKHILKKVVSRLRRLYSTIGHGNFGILDFDDGLTFAKLQAAVGAFSPEELQFLEMIFYRDAGDYGFLGEKQIVTLRQKIRKRDIFKVPYTGNYLFRGESVEKYEKIKKDLGKDVLLTSGIRGLTKQYYLFLRKAALNNGNLSLASRSLAPPGYSYHATGDFDIGQLGFGKGNFSERFTDTPVFQKLAQRGYVTYRYEKDNDYGVRYEPWHIKLVG